jgi:hypothetical protein
MATIGQVREQCQAVRGYEIHLAPQAQREGRRTRSGQGNVVCLFFFTCGSNMFYVLIGDADNAIGPDVAIGRTKAANAR